MKSPSRHTTKAKQKTNNILAILTLCTLAITAIILGQFLILDDRTNNTLQEGTVINGFNLSGMKKDEAQVLLINKFNDLAKDFNLKIKDPTSERTWTLKGEEFSVVEDLSEVFEISQDKSQLLNEKITPTTLVSQFEKDGGAINVSFNYMLEGIDQRIEEIIQEAEVAPVCSDIEFISEDRGYFEISESVSGKRVNKSKLYSDINEQFLINNDISVEMDFIEEVPAITYDYNSSLTQKIASFSTNVADSTGGRKHNVKQALKQFDGMIVLPRQSVSFNNIIGEHTFENGYKTATIIFNGEFTDGIGGGICQASTTLYNALLLSGMQIDEVHKHTLPVRYVPLGLDAMVAEYTSDLKFTNPTDYPIYIDTYSDSESVTVDIYSKPSIYTYKTRSETVNTFKNAGDKIIVDTDGKYSNKVLFKGEYFRLSYPKDGYEAKAYLQTYLNGELLEEKLIRHEIYQAQKGVIIEGAEEVPEGLTPIDSGVKIIQAEE